MQKEIFWIRIPASTSNIGPGFDTLGLALKIYNEIEIYGINKNFKIEYVYPANIKIKPNNNLYLKAYKVACMSLGVEETGFSAKIYNRIPIGAGLGSSGGAVIGGVITAFLLSGKKIDTNKVLNIAIKIERHPDNITPCLVGGFTLSSVVNSNVYFKKFRIDQGLKAVVVTPDFILETKKARKVLPERLKLKDAIFNISRVAYLVGAFEKNELKDIQWAFHDRLHQPARSKLVPGLNEIIEQAHSGGAVGCFLSGAGPSVVALCLRNAEKIGRLIVKVWREFNINSKFIVTGIDNNGVKIIK